MSLDDDLLRWQDAGLLDRRQASAIAAFEAVRAAPKEDRPGIVEAVVYLALAIIGVGVFVLVAASWHAIGSWGRVALPALASAATLSAGTAMLRSGQAGLRRGGSIAWLLAVGAIAVTLAVAGHEGGLASEDSGLLAGGIATAVAIALWVIRPSHAQVLGIGVGVFVLALDAADRGSGNAGSFVAFGSTLAGFGLVGLVLTELRFFRPPPTAGSISAVAMAAGGFVAALPDSPALAQGLFAVVAAVLIATSIRRGVFLYMAFGVGALFLGLITVILRHTNDPTAAAIALIGLGVVTLGGVIVLVRAKPWRREQA